jgi:hypothetical protein
MRIEGASFRHLGSVWHWEIESARACRQGPVAAAALSRPLEETRYLDSLDVAVRPLGQRREPRREAVSHEMANPKDSALER